MPKIDTENSSKEECYEIEIPLNLLQYLSSDNCNIQALCRICFSINNNELFPLITTAENKLLQEMFTSFTAIQVYPSDGLPTQICGSCKTQIVNCYEFKVRCVKSDCTLRSLLNGEFVARAEHKNSNDDTNDFQEFKLSKNNKYENIKKEDFSEEMTDVQYLDGLSESDNEMLYIVQNSQIKDDLDSTVPTLKPESQDISLKKCNRKVKKPLICSFCSKRISSKKAMKSHISRVHNSTRHPNSCGECKESFESEHDLNLHIPVHGLGPLWKCVECHKDFKGRSMLKRHIQRHMEKKRYACEVCGKPFAELYALRRHVRVHTGEGVEKRHACHICEKRYSDRGLLNAHLTRHSSARPCVCAACGKAFRSTRLLASHHLVHSEEKPHKCRYCDKRFRHESTRNTHHRTHTGEKPYVCNTCGKRFIQNSNLTLHMRTHTGERPYDCGTCGRKFTSGSTLKTHIRTHTGDKPYQCPICGKRFARMDLRAHMRQHTGERPFECPVCTRRFITAPRLRDHFRIHTGEKPFECSICSLKFSSKSQLVRHNKTHSKKKRSTFTPSQKDSNQTCIENDKIISKESIENIENVSNIDVTDTDAKEIIIKTTHDDADVSGEIILQSEDSQTKNIETGALCLSGTNGGINYASDMNVVTVSDVGGVRIASSAIECATVKLYQVDQSLVQIHSSGGQVTISKITSKMTANF